MTGPASFQHRNGAPHAAVRTTGPLALAQPGQHGQAGRAGPAKGATHGHLEGLPVTPHLHTEGLTRPRGVATATAGEGTRARPGPCRDPRGPDTSPLSMQQPSHARHRAGGGL